MDYVLSMHGASDLHGPARFELVHELAPILPHFAGIGRRRALRRDPIYRRHRAEIERVLGGFEWDLRGAPDMPRGRALRAVAWNVERGKRYREVGKLLAERPELAGADLVLLNEVDIGMGRSGNANVAAELANLLGLRYVYCNFELLLSEGDAFERDHGIANTLSLHGTALLTRLPILRIGAVTLPEFTDKFHADEKRLGGKRALFCEVRTEAGPLLVVVPHLDPFAGPRHRAAQMRRIIRHIGAWSTPHVLLGGDLNTNTYNLGTKRGLAMNLAHKLVRLGFDETIRQYMTPEEIYERAMFDALREGGLDIEGFNERALGTMFYDMGDPEIRDWTERYVPRPARAWLERRLAPWGGAVPMKLDWFAGRELRPLAAGVVDRPTTPDGLPVSDHSPLHLEFELR